MTTTRATRLAALAVLATTACLAGTAGPAAASGGGAPARYRPAATVRAGLTGHAPVARPATLARPATPARLPSRAPAPPAGALPQTGCTLSGTTATCDLYAKPGTVQLPGQAAPTPIWGFASTPEAAATLPGPVLVVDQGMQVTLSLHNGLSTALSLAVPAMTGLPPDAAGAAAGGDRTYTFTASRPGTYLYEAGHTVDGARQAAMGLVGALVVRAPALADGTPTGYGTADSAYDDEAVLVLTEVDPALNNSAAPLSFDLRRYAPKYRLINGKAYPETDPLGSDVGRRVLLRYVDAGLAAHAMTVMGGEQRVVGTDARPSSYPQTLVTLPLPPGRAADTVVTLPTVADGARFAVMESGGMLDNNGQTYGTAQPGISPVLAFGGMLTFIDTDPAPPSGDLVGPVASHVTAAPASVSVLGSVTVTADFSDAATGGSPVDRAELVIDDLSVGEGTSPYAFAGSFGGPTVTGATATLDTTALQTLTQGRHTVYVRAHDTAGNWGVVNSAVFTLSVTGASTTAVTVTPTPTNGDLGAVVTATADDSALGGTVDEAEYFLDATGADGAGSPMTLVSPGAGITDMSAVLPPADLLGLPEGRHTVYVHSHDSFGLWGPYAGADLVVDRTGPTLASGGVLPAITDGTNGSPSDPTDLRVNATFTDPDSGGVSSPVAAAEGFIDTGGADGTGFTMVALDGSFDSATEASYGLVPLSELTALASGVHQIFVHGRDAAGNWGPLTALTFILDRTGPTVSGLTASPNPTNQASTLTLAGTATDTLTAITAAEWFEGADPGAGAGHPMTVTATGPTTATVSATVDLRGFAAGSHTLLARARDAAGHWGATASVSVSVQPPNAIFADGFESGDTSAWSGSTGGPVVDTGSALAGTYGLAVSGSTPRYVTDATPAAEASLHARFQLRAGTLDTTGNNTVTLLQAATGGGTAMTVVQFRRNNQGAQVRLGVLRSNGWAYSAWLGVGTGVATVRVDWAAGTSTTNTLTVTTGSTATASVTGANTSAYRVESVALGVVASTGTTSGSAAIDSYVSTRYTLP